MILDSSVGRARVCGCRAGWQGATTRMAAPCKEEQRSQTARQPCNRVRSGITQMVNTIGGTNASIHVTFQGPKSGQLRNLG
jgi:hypothetical protein